MLTHGHVQRSTGRRAVVAALLNRNVVKDATRTASRLKGRLPGGMPSGLPGGSTTAARPEMAVRAEMTGDMARNTKRRADYIN
jgi:hypothetical protein